MPSGKMVAWIVGLSLATALALEHYKAKQTPSRGASTVQRLRTA